MAWLEVHQALFTHRKILQLAELLDLPEVYASAHLIALWTWALDNAPNACLPCSVRIIAKAAQYPGDAAFFVRSCVDVGFIDEINGGDSLLIHDWDDYAGKLLYQRKRNSAKQREWRKRQQNSDVTEEPSLLDGDVTVTSPLHNRTQNSTEPLKKEGGAKSAPPTPKQNNQTSFPENFVIDEADKVWAKENVPGLDLQYATREWTTSMRANTTKYRYTNWHLAWRKGMLNAVKWNEAPNGRGHPGMNGMRPVPPASKEW